MQSLIRSLGYDAVTFCSAEEFLELTDMLATECLIVDVQMPGLSGIELQQRLIADGHHFPMIFVTAFPNDRLRASVFKNGAIGYLSKPFRDHRLDRVRKRGAEEPRALAIRMRSRYHPDCRWLIPLHRGKVPSFQPMVTERICRRRRSLCYPPPTLGTLSRPIQAIIAAKVVVRRLKWPQAEYQKIM